MSACPICDASLEEMGKGEGERHVEACCNGGAVGKVADSAGESRAFWEEGWS